MGYCRLIVRGKSRVPVFREEKIEGIGAWSENVQFVLWVGLSSVRETHEFGLAGMFASETVARCALRWQVLHRRAHQQSLLPLDLSCTYSQRKRYLRNSSSPTTRSRRISAPAIFTLGAVSTIPHSVANRKQRRSTRSSRFMLPTARPSPWRWAA